MMNLIQGVPSLSLSGLISFIIQWIVILFALAFSDAIIEHNIEFKRLTIISFLSYLITPLVLMYSPIVFMYDFIIMPLVVWIILGEILLREATIKQRALITIIGYVIYYFLLIINVPYMIHSLIPI